MLKSGEVKFFSYQKNYILIFYKINIKLARRKKIKAEAKEDAINALEEGNIEDAMKFK